MCRRPEIVHWCGPHQCDDFRQLIDGVLRCGCSAAATNDGEHEIGQLLNMSWPDHVRRCVRDPDRLALQRGPNHRSDDRSGTATGTIEVADIVADLGLRRPARADNHCSSGGRGLRVVELAQIDDRIPLAARPGCLRDQIAHAVLGAVERVAADDRHGMTAIGEEADEMLTERAVSPPKRAGGQWFAGAWGLWCAQPLPRFGLPQ